MGLPITVTKTLAAAAATNIALSQSPGAAGNLTINGTAATGGVATLDTQRLVIITSAGNDSGRTFTIYGTNQNGNAISEAITGANAGVATSTKSFLTVTRISVDAATAGAVTAGTSGVGSTQLIGLNPHVTPANTSIGVVVSGTVNFTVEYTYDNDPFQMIMPTPGAPGPTMWPLAALAAKAANTDALLVNPATALRLTINSGTGSATMTVLAADISGA